MPQNLMILFFPSRHLCVLNNFISLLSFSLIAMVVSIVELNKTERFSYTGVLRMARPTPSQVQLYITYFKCPYLTT